MSTSEVTITNSVVKNQDACVAISSGSNFVFSNNQCSGGHGIIIGPIASKTVSGVTIAGNTVTASTMGLSIEVDADATGGVVNNVTYSGNNISGITKYGVLITQSYPAGLGIPGTDSTVGSASFGLWSFEVGRLLTLGFRCLIDSNIDFTGATTSVAVNSAAVGLEINLGHCTGTWDFSSLKVTGGTGNKIVGGCTVSLTRAQTSLDSICLSWYTYL